MPLKISKFGSNPIVKIAEEDIWDGQGIYQYLTIAEKLKISSDDDKDKVSEAGANKIQIYGCDGDYVEQNEIIELDGTNPVETQLEYLRVWRLINRSGNSKNNIGNILAKNNAENNILAQILPRNNQTLMALWTVPYGMSFKMISWYGSVAMGKETTFSLYVRPLGEVFHIQKPVNYKDGFFNQPTPLEYPLEAGTDIAIRASSVAPGGKVSAGFDGFYE